MPQVTISPQPKFSSETATGTPLSGGKLYTYAAGTSTPQATYTGWDGSVVNANPVILDARGEADVWLLQGQGYKFELRDSDNVLIWTADSINSAPPGGYTELFGDGTVTNPSISFINSTSMGFYRIAANTLGVATSGAEAMRIDPSQNIGIGVVPTTKLDVNGNVRLRGATTITTGGLTVSAGGASVTGDITVTGNSTLTGTLGVTGDTTITGVTAITGNTSVSGGTFTTRGLTDSATAHAWDIDANGRLLNTANTQVSFRAYRNTGSGAQISGTLIGFNGSTYNYGGGFDQTTSTFTVPVAGRYIFTVCIDLFHNGSGSAWAGAIALTKNGGSSCVVNFQLGDNDERQFNLASLEQCAVGDTFQVVLTNAMSSSRMCQPMGNGGPTHFAGHLIC